MKIFNKFIKKGKKAFARRQLFTALRTLRFTLRRPPTFSVLLRLLRQLRIPLILVARRQGRQMLDVPVPPRRNKRNILSMQTLFVAVSKRRERQLWARVEQEFTSILLAPRHSSTLHQRDAEAGRIYEERVNMERR